MADAYQSNTLGLLFFVVALIYLTFLVLIIVLTSRMLFSCKKYPNTKPMKIFRLFFCFIWLQMLLNTILYWVLFAQEAGGADSSSSEV